MSLTTEIIRGSVALAGFAGFAGWIIVRTVRKAEDPASAAFKWVLSIPIVILAFMAIGLFGPFGPFLIVACAVVLSFLWTPSLGAFLVKPLTSMIDGGDEPLPPQPTYSVAQSKQKQGKYLEAGALLRQQLNRFPSDYEGQMLAAQSHAESPSLADLSGAEKTIEELCAQPGHAAKNIAFALYSMADWQLKYGQDAEAARRHLQKIIELFPESEFAQGAAHRIAHLGSPGARQPRTFTVAEGPKYPGLAREGRAKLPPDIPPGEAAAHYVRHLEQHPLDAEAREKLAILYADHYGHLELARDQLEQLIAQPNQPSKLIAHWLNLLADLQIRCGADLPAVQATLQRIIDRDPGLAAAEKARHRLALLKLEFKARDKNPSVKLGSYEQRIGLKRGLPSHKL